MVRVAIINAVYPPEPVVSARLGQDLAHELVGRGCAVTVLCPQPSRPVDTEHSQYRNCSQPHVSRDGDIEVVRLPSFTAPQSRLMARSRESLSFGMQACRYLRRHHLQPDVLYVNAWPLLSQGLLARYARRTRVPMVLHVQDIYPESLLTKLPRMVRGIVGAPLTRLDRWSARQAAVVVVISENMRRIYVEARGIPPEKVLAINNWQDEQSFANVPSRSEACAKYDVPHEPFTFVYLGNIGPIAGVDLLIQSFCKARLSTAQLLIIGGGSAKAAHEELALRLGTSNVRFISDPVGKNVSLLQSMAHVCLLPMKRGAGMSSIPSKLPAYMFSAKPVLASVDAESDTARAISEAQCGWIEEPEDVQGLAEKMRDVASFPAAELDRIGRRGHSYGLAHYSKAVGVRKLAHVVLRAGGSA
jgi:glycosyltransferase involved in cell wall biosynthesis